jgi:hypothetical protein
VNSTLVMVAKLPAIAGDSSHLTFGDTILPSGCGRQFGVRGAPIQTHRGQGLSPVIEDLLTVCQHAGRERSPSTQGAIRLAVFARFVIPSSGPSNKK